MRTRLMYHAACKVEVVLTADVFQLFIKILRRMGFGALFSGQRGFAFLCCDTRIYLRLRGCPVVLDIELSVSAWYHKTRRVLLRARRLLLLLLTAEIRERRRAVCGVTFKLTST